MNKETLEKINKFTRREFTEDELYVFPVKLCGNEIDRDYERFSDSALESLKELMIGASGIFDHDPRAGNQTARIFDTEIVTDESKTTKYGQPYRYLKGMAYAVRTEANKDLIAEIDGGIKKEVSIGCSAAKKICSICGQDQFTGSCEHKKGAEYSGQMCHHILDDITDAYEWSFVAVPAQADAGITKKLHKEAEPMEFTPISTQAEFDAAVQSRIDAAVTDAKKGFEGWISPEDHQKALDTLSAEKKKLELSLLRLNAAGEAGLPSELADRLTGESEEEIRADAEKLASFMKPAHQTPSRSAEGEGLSGVEKAFYARNPELRKEN